MLPTTYLLYAAALAASALGTRPAPELRSYAYSITDFQGHRLDLVGGRAERFTPWVIISSMDARQVYEVVSVAGRSVLSHTTALLTPAGPAPGTQIVGGNETLFWRLQDAPDAGTRERGADSGDARSLLDADTGLALTAWPAAGGPSSPLTLEPADEKNARQVFNVTCLYSWSFPGPLRDRQRARHTSSRMLAACRLRREPRELHPRRLQTDGARDREVWPSLICTGSWSASPHPRGPYTLNREREADRSVVRGGTHKIKRSGRRELRSPFRHMFGLGRVKAHSTKICGLPGLVGENDSNLPYEAQEQEQDNTYRNSKIDRCAGIGAAQGLGFAVERSRV
ncbi:hypothetical protein B0H15DRAFT_802355 [Mycena belliarum]|uniref:Uncharacterized protein n=1 Tax=Mycena belliarum TaxID=1033014 RepID=A0AAD6TZB9_9AGAR|nr:hypothetical protein B0H15DRAFT_802355 [Mycena belliae]